ncbi:hypothetical protein [Phenylobacterium sp.]|uniref:hypothetical protein n=1 Tax=Phenylobacterium sp. TaxID=1871053 RepID=UPI0035B48FB3
MAENWLTKKNAHGFSLGDALYAWGGMLKGDADPVGDLTRRMDARKQEAAFADLAGMFGGGGQPSQVLAGGQGVDTLAGGAGSPRPTGWSVMDQPKALTDAGVGGAGNPGGAEMWSRVNAAKSPRDPMAAAQGAASPTAGGGLDRGAIIQKLLSNSATRELGMQALLEDLKVGKGGARYGFQNLGGRVVRTDPTTGEAVEVFAAPDSGINERGLTPIYGRDENGNTVVMFPSKSGELYRPQLPTGVSGISPGVVQTDRGTSVELRDNRTGRVIDTAAKDNYGQASQSAAGRVAGETQATAAAGLGQVIENANLTLGAINDIMTNPAFNDRVGMKAVLPAIPGTAGVGFDAQVDQLKGQVFLRAFESLRGAGAITEQEGQAATKAMSRLDRRQSPEDFRAALGELQGIISRGVQRAQAKAAGAGAVRPAQPAANRGYSVVSVRRAQ